MNNQGNIEIDETKLDPELKKTTNDGFAEHAIRSVGSDGNMEEITLVARNGGGLLGDVNGKSFWGALHIKYLYVNPESKGKGIGKILLNQALEKGNKLRYRFSFVETMNFQAVDFYKSMGFEEELIRSGFDNDTTFHYLKKTLDNHLK